METITSSYNLFVDSSRSHTAGSKGDDFLVNLQDAGVHAGDGEHIRLNLENFSMAKNFSDVNDNNNQFRLYSTDITGFDHIGYLAKKNYKSVFDLATAFADALRKLLADNITACTEAGAHSGISPGAANISTDNIIEFTVNTTGSHGLTAAKTILQFNADESDSYELLGGDRVINGDDTTSSVTLTVPSVTSIKIVCKYPAQRSTTPFIYVRAPGVLNTNIETKGLKNHKDDHKSDTANSDILGRVVVESSEWVQYTAQTGREFFLDIHQKQLNFLRLRLTDSHNRPIGRKTETNTATGSGSDAKEQSTLGNLNFSAVIRFDIVKRRTVQHLETEHYKPNVPARFSNGIVNQLRNGKDTFGMSPGM